MGEAEQITNGTLDAGMCLSLPPDTNDAGPLDEGTAVGCHPEVTDGARPFEVAQLHCLARFDVSRRRAFTARSQIAGGFPSRSHFAGRIFERDRA